MSIPRIHPRAGRGTAVVLLLLCATAVLFSPTPVIAQETEDEVTPARVAGEDRFETAANIATLTFDAASTAVLAAGESFPDALAASFAAGSVDGPVLLVEQDAIPPVTWDALAQLGVESVVLVGGPAAIDPTVETSLAGEGYRTERIAGVDRFETASAIATTYGTDVVGTVDGDRTALLARGDDFPDALSAGPAAAAANLPLLLTPQDAADGSVDEALQALAIERIIVLGGTAAVSEGVVAVYEQDYAVERFAGANRAETATVVADNLVDRLPGFSRETVLLARGDDFPDALTASTHAASLGAPILLAATPGELSSPTRQWLSANCPEISVIRALGGTAAVSQALLDDAVGAASACLDTGPEAVSSFTTDLVPGQDRNINIHLAADYIDGSVIDPGESFSLNAGIGPRTADRGFVPNGFIDEDGEVVSVVGGGVSQMGTTFVNAAWFAGIEIEEFRPHTTYFERYPMCREATLAWDILDVVVTNDSPYPITVSTAYTDASVTVTFLSESWAEVDSWIGDPYDIEGPGGAFSVDCGRTITYPDATDTTETHSWRYDSGFPG